MVRRTAALDDVVTADVLVVGGGFAGVWAALRAAECDVSVVLVDKAFVSRSGASTMSGGVTTAPLPGEDLEPWVREFVEFGAYMTNEEWTRQLLSDQVERIQDYVSWGVPIVRDPDGTIQRRKSRGMVHVRCLQYTPKRAMEILRARALTAGVRIIDRVAVQELLTTDGVFPTRGRVCGAIGIHTRTGQPLVFRSKAVVLATGPQAIKGFHPIDNDTSDGFAMGYRVGGRCVDMEFASGGTFSVLTVGDRQYHFGNFNVAVAHGARLINRLGERFMERYDPVRLERSELNRVVAGFVKEVVDGRGPVFIDLTTCDDSYWDALLAVRGGRRTGALLSGEVPDPREHPIVIEPTWSLWNGGRGGLQIDLSCRTNVAGLYAAGGVARNDAVGRHASAGTPTAFCKVSGYRAGQAAAQEAMETVLPGARAADILDVASRLVDPIGREGPFSADAIHEGVAEILGSPDCLMIQNEQRISRVLDSLAALERELPGVRVDSPHELIKYHEAASTIQAARLVYLAMLDRTESRENFYREDYPETDDVNWLCWHTVERTADGPFFQRQRIPHERYLITPPERRGVRLSPIAAIMREQFDLSVQLPYKTDTVTRETS